MSYCKIKAIKPNLIFILSLFYCFGRVSATDTSGAVVCWIMLVITILAIGTGNLFYLVYIQKKPLGKSSSPNDIESSKFISKSMDASDRVNKLPTTGVGRASNYKLRYGDNEQIRREDSKNLEQSSGSQSQNKVLSKDEEKILGCMLGFKKEKQPMDGDQFQVHIDADVEEDIDN